MYIASTWFRTIQITVTQDCTYCYYVIGGACQMKNSTPSTIHETISVQSDYEQKTYVLIGSRDSRSHRRRSDISLHNKISKFEILYTAQDRKQLRSRWSCHLLRSLTTYTFFFQAFMASRKPLYGIRAHCHPVIQSAGDMLIFSSTLSLFTSMTSCSQSWILTDHQRREPERNATGAIARSLSQNVYRDR